MKIAQPPVLGCSRSSRCWTTGAPPGILGVGFCFVWNQLELRTNGLKWILNAEIWMEKTWLLRIIIQKRHPEIGGPCKKGYLRMGIFHSNRRIINGRIPSDIKHHPWLGDFQVVNWMRLDWANMIAGHIQIVASIGRLTNINSQEWQ